MAKDKEPDKETEEKVRRALKAKAAEVHPKKGLKEIREKTERKKKLCE